MFMPMEEGQAAGEPCADARAPISVSLEQDSRLCGARFVSLAPRIARRRIRGRPRGRRAIAVVIGQGDGGGGKDSWPPAGDRHVVVRPSVAIERDGHAVDLTEQGLMVLETLQLLAFA
jgi:hypothetical protein